MTAWFSNLRFWRGMHAKAAFLSQKPSAQPSAVFCSLASFSENAIMRNTDAYRLPIFPLSPYQICLWSIYSYFMPICCRWNVYRKPICLNGTMVLSRPNFCGSICFHFCLYYEAAWCFFFFAESFWRNSQFPKMIQRGRVCETVWLGAIGNNGWMPSVLVFSWNHLLGLFPQSLAPHPSPPFVFPTQSRFHLQWTWSKEGMIEWSSVSNE